MLAHFRDYAVAVMQMKSAEYGEQRYEDPFLDFERKLGESNVLIRKNADAGHNSVHREHCIPSAESRVAHLCDDEATLKVLKFMKNLAEALQMSLTLKFEKIVPVIMKKTLGESFRISFGENHAQSVEKMRRPIKG